MKILTTFLLLFPLALMAQKKVGINTTNPEHPFQVNVDSTFLAVGLDQSNPGTLNTLSLTPGTNMGAQSLTVGITGQLAKVSITLGTSDIDELYVEAYRGNGPGGSWMAGQTIYDISGTGIFEITFPQPWPTVTAGEIINFIAFPVIGTSMLWRRNTNDAYSGGQAYFHNGSTWTTLSYDLAFRSYVAVPDTTSVEVLSVQNDGRVRVKNYVFPELDGTEGQVMSTNGAGVLTWVAPEAFPSQTQILDADGDTRVRVEAAPDEDIIRFNTAGTEKMNILSNGNVGIGTSTSTGKLQVRHNSLTSNPQLRLTETSANDFARIKFETESDPGLFWDIAGLADSSASVSKINFYYSNPGSTGDKMTITGEGSVGIGTTSPGNRLRINGSTTSSQHILSAGANYVGNVDIRAVEGFSTPATGYGIGGYFIGGKRGIQSFGNGGESTGLTIAVEGSASGTAGTRTGLFGRATGGTTNWAGYFAEGNVIAENNLYVEGSVGIGTTSPGNKLRVNGSASSSQHVFSAGTNYAGNVDIRAVEGFSTPAVGYGIGGYFIGGKKAIDAEGSGGAATGTVTGVEATATGSAGTRVGLFAAAIGGATNWAGYFAEGNVRAENNLYIDGNVGIGTTSPGNKLRVNGSASSSQHVFSAGTNYSGNVHIRAVEGFSTPAVGYGFGGYFIGGSKGIDAEGSGGAATGTVTGVEATATGTAGTRIGLYAGAVGGATNWAGYFAEGNVYITNQLRVGSAASGGVPGYKLMVDGKIIAEEVRVQMSDDWPDYVFNADYALMPIDQLKQEIAVHGHLPGIPSAHEIEAEGVQLGDMQRRMMEKIEELTLYIIQQQEQIDDLQLQLKSQQTSKK